MLRDYGLSVFGNGVVLHSDGRRRWYGDDGQVELVPEHGRGKEVRHTGTGRGHVAELSQKSAKRLTFLIANAATVFRSMLTLTYRAVFAGVEDAMRNAKIVRRSKSDLNRFLSCMRRELGAYVWVQELQQRGVIHYHVICEREPSQERVALVWCRAIGALDDQAALKHGAKIDPIRGEREARVYLGAYVGKQRQKVLPAGVAAAGRWWGRARSVSLRTLATVVTCTQGEVHHAETEARIVRAARRYLRGKLGFKYRSGMVLDWGGTLSAGVARVVEDLRRYYGHCSHEAAVLPARGWEPAGGAR